MSSINAFLAGNVARERGKKASIGWSVPKQFVVLEACSPLFLRHGSVYADGRKVLFNQQLGQGDAPRHSLHENDDLLTENGYQ